MPVEETEDGKVASVIARVASVVAPLTVAVTGMLYVAAWMVRYRTIVPFGLSGDMFEHPIQDTLAQGYGPVLIGTIIMTAVAVCIWGVTLLVRWRPTFITYYSSDHSLFFRAQLMLTVAMILLSYGVFAGSVMGDRRAALIIRTVLSGCREGCNVYVSNGKPALGRIIAQDKTRIAVFTKSGVMILKNDTLVQVIPIGPIKTRLLY